MDELISKDYAAVRRARIDPTNVLPNATAGDPSAHSETVYLTVVDKDRNAVSLIESIFAKLRFESGSGRARFRVAEPRHGLFARGGSSE